MGQFDHPLDRIEGAEGVGEVNEGRQFHPPAVQQAFVLVQDQFARVGERRDL